VSLSWKRKKHNTKFYHAQHPKGKGYYGQNTSQRKIYLDASHHVWFAKQQLDNFFVYIFVAIFSKSFCLNNFFNDKENGMNTKEV
jgi:hypothetical protein